MLGGFGIPSCYGCYWVLASRDRCEYIAVAADHYSPGGHGNDAASREAKEIRANKVLVNCFGVSSVKDRQDTGCVVALSMLLFFVVAADVRSLSQIYGWVFDAS